MGKGKKRNLLIEAAHRKVEEEERFPLGDEAALRLARIKGQLEEAEGTEKDDLPEIELHPEEVIFPDDEAEGAQAPEAAAAPNTALLNEMAARHAGITEVDGQTVIAVTGTGPKDDTAAEAVQEKPQPIAEEKRRWSDELFAAAQSLAKQDVAQEQLDAFVALFAKEFGKGKHCIVLCDLLDAAGVPRREQKPILRGVKHATSEAKPEAKAEGEPEAKAEGEPEAKAEPKSFDELEALAVEFFAGRKVKTSTNFIGHLRSWSKGKGLNEEELTILTRLVAIRVRFAIADSDLRKGEFNDLGCESLLAMLVISGKWIFADRKFSVNFRRWLEPSAQILSELGLNEEELEPLTQRITDFNNVMATGGSAASLCWTPQKFAEIEAAYAAKKSTTQNAGAPDASPTAPAAVEVAPVADVSAEVGAHVPAEVAPEAEVPVEVVPVAPEADAEGEQHEADAEESLQEMYERLFGESQAEVPAQAGAEAAAVDQDCGPFALPAEAEAAAVVGDPIVVERLEAALNTAEAQADAANRRAEQAERDAAELARQLADAQAAAQQSVAPAAPKLLSKRGWVGLAAAAILVVMLGSVFFGGGEAEVKPTVAKAPKVETPAPTAAPEAATPPAPRAEAPVKTEVPTKAEEPAKNEGEATVEAKAEPVAEPAVATSQDETVVLTLVEKPDFTTVSRWEVRHPVSAFGSLSSNRDYHLTEKLASELTSGDALKKHVANGKYPSSAGVFFYESDRNMAAWLLGLEHLEELDLAKVSAAAEIKQEDGSVVPAKASDGTPIRKIPLLVKGSPNPAINWDRLAEGLKDYVCALNEDQKKAFFKQSTAAAPQAAAAA